MPLIFLLLILTACQPDLENQPKTRDWSDTRTPVEGTVAFLKASDQRPQVTVALIKQGQQSYEIYCSVCHDHIGYGAGMVVQRGFQKIESFHSAQMRNKTDEQIYQTISQGKDNMPAFAAELSPYDRCTVVAYIRALQMSQHTSSNDLSRDDLSALERSNNE